MKEPERSTALQNAITFSRILQMMVSESDTEVLWTWRGLMKMTTPLYDFRKRNENRTN